MRKGLIVGASMMGVGFALTLLAFAVLAVFGEDTPSGGQELTGGLAGVAGLSLLGGAALMILAVPVGLVVLFVSAFARGSANPAYSAPVSPLLRAPETLAPPDLPPLPTSESLPPPDPRDQVVPLPWASDMGFSVQEVAPAARRPLAWRMIVGTFVTFVFAVVGWTAVVQPMVGKYLFLDGVPARATVVSVERLLDTCVLTVQYEAPGVTLEVPAAMSDSDSCQVRVGATEEIVYSSADPSVWRYSGLLTFPFVAVGVFLVAVVVFWTISVFGRQRRPAVLRLQRIRT